MTFYGAARILSFFLSLAAFVLLLLATLSVPIIKDFDFLRATFADGTRLTSGIWGYCVHPAGGGSPTCHQGLGFTLSSDGFAGRTHNGFANGKVDNGLIGRPLTVAFVMYPIATAATFGAMVGSISSNRVISILAVLQMGGAFVMSVACWIPSAIVFSAARERLLEQFPPGTSKLGPAFFFGVGAFSALFVAQISMFAGHVPSKQEREKKRTPGKAGKRADFGNVDWSDEEYDGRRKRMTEV